MKVNKIRFTGFISTFLLISNTWANDLTGTWKTIDDKSGSAGANVLIYKNNDGTYAGKIEKIYDLPNGAKPKVGKCTVCKGELKDKPIIGLRILSNFVENTQNKNEYIHGQVVDSETGNTYKGKIKIHPNGKKITLRGYIGVSVLGRSQTWIKID